MISGIEPLFSEIAESMAQSIPEDWSTASFEAIFYPGSSRYEAEYTRKFDGVARSFQPGMSGSRAFRKLRQAFRNANATLWGRARLHLKSDGSFKIDWGYEDCDQDGNAIFNEEAEVRRHEARHNRLTRLWNRLRRSRHWPSNGELRGSRPHPSGWGG